MNPNTMTLADLWDWLYSQAKLNPVTWKEGPTLDAIERARPEGWRVLIEQAFNTWYGWAGQTGADRWGCWATRAPTRLLCEARLCVAMHLAEGKK